ncbi:MAG: phosphoribosylglycinamide formyltransferase [Armatimonadota bacterium]
MTRIAVMVSGAGRGSNMQAIIDACASGQIDGEVAVVIGVKNDAPAMERARSQSVKTVSISPKGFENTQDYDDAVLKTLQENRIDLICLAGYMRILGQNIIDTYRNAIMNVHPALIPSFCGKGMYGHHVHEAVIARGVKYTGVTVHFVDEDYDSGPIIAQTVVPVEQDDTPDTVAARVLEKEHETYAYAVSLFAQGRLRVVNRKVILSPEESSTGASPSPK